MKKVGNKKDSHECMLRLLFDSFLSFFFKINNMSTTNPIFVANVTFEQRPPVNNGHVFGLEDGRCTQSWLYLYWIQTLYLTFTIFEDHLRDRSSPWELVLNCFEVCPFETHILKHISLRICNIFQDHLWDRSSPWEWKWSFWRLLQPSPDTSRRPGRFDKSGIRGATS